MNSYATPSRTAPIGRHGTKPSLSGSQTGYAPMALAKSLIISTRKRRSAVNKNPSYVQEDSEEKAVGGSQKVGLQISKIIERYGPPAYFNSRGRLDRINQPFWAALFAIDNNIIFEPNLDQFFAYDQSNGIWREQSVDTIRKRIAGRIFEAEHRWEEYPRLSEQRTEKVIAGIIAHLRGEVEEMGAFAGKTNLLHLANCSIRVGMDGPTIEPISLLHRACWRSPIIYDPRAKCPRFLEMLLAPLDSEQKLVLQKMFGLFLTGQNPAHKIVILDGEGGSGKTTVALVFQEILGPKRIGSLRTKYLENRFDIGRFYEKTLLIGADVAAEFL